MRFVSDEDRKMLDAMMSVDLGWCESQEDGQRWFDVLGKTKPEQDMLDDVDRTTNLIGFELDDELDNLLDWSGMADDEEDTVFTDEMLESYRHARRRMFASRDQRNPYKKDLLRFHYTKLKSLSQYKTALRRWHSDDIDNRNHEIVLSFEEQIEEDRREKERADAIDDLISDSTGEWIEEFEDDEPGTYVGAGDNRTYHTQL